MIPAPYNTWPVGHEPEQSGQADGDRPQDAGKEQATTRTVAQSR